MFADDTSLFIKNRVQAAVKINDDLAAVSQCAKRWLVSFSPPKPESLIIANKSD